MNIVVVGAGAIGSLFGAILSQQAKITLIGRKAHVAAIKKYGLQITGKTNTTISIPAYENVKNVGETVDLLMLTVKAYDTESAIQTALPLISEHTMVLSLQNGLNNIEKIIRYVPREHVLAGITTHGARVEKPGVVNHTGFGWTILGELHGRSTQRLQELVKTFNAATIKTQATTNITKEIWSKAIINSSINPLTAYLRCKNGYLLQNPLIEQIVYRICKESTVVANTLGFDFNINTMYTMTKKVIADTKANDSSMLQSIRRGHKTEIDAINGQIVALGNQHNIDITLNEVLMNLIQIHYE